MVASGSIVPATTFGQRGGETSSVGGAISASAVPSPDDDQCASIKYSRGKIEGSIITEVQARSLAADGEDLFWNRLTGQISVRPESGPRISYFGGFPGIGDDVGTPLLRLLMFRAGARVTGMTLAAVPQLCCVAGWALTGLIRRIRKALDESGRQPWFIITESEGYRWHFERTWHYVAPLDALDNFDRTMMPKPTNA